MGEILGLGLSHYPLLRSTDDNMASILRATLKRPDVPEEWKDARNWPEAMRAEWGNDEGRTSAAVHRAEFVKHLRVLRQKLDEFKPDIVVMWGDDQYENFKEDIVPPFCVYAFEDVDMQPYASRRQSSARPGGDTPRLAPAEGRNNAWGEPEDSVFHIKGNRAAAKYLAIGLLQEKVDVAYAYEPLHYEGLSHAFLNGVLYLDYDRTGFDYPLLPMAVNCYGRRVLVNRGGLYPVGRTEVPEGDLDPPGPSPERCMEVGAAVARVMRRSPWRTALVASSSWSHAFLVPKHFFIYPDVESDRRLYEALVAGDYDTWRCVTEPEVVDRGQQEVLNWWCLLGAMEELGHSTPDYTGYVESYVMNSNKCFVLYGSR